MESRSAQLRRQHRKVLWWALVVAAAVHAVVLFRVAIARSAATGPIGPRPELVGMIEKPKFVEVEFGPPTLVDREGARWVEPREHRLLAQRLTRLPPECDAFVWTADDQLDGRVWVRVDTAGYAHVDRIDRGTGEVCGDAVVRRVAGALRYHWLPTDRFPAPVEVLQPVSISAVQ